MKVLVNCNCGYHPSAVVQGFMVCCKRLVSVKFGKSQPPEEMQWFIKCIVRKQLAF